MSKTATIKSRMRPPRMQEEAGAAAVVLSMLQVQVDVHTITTQPRFWRLFYDSTRFSSRSTLSVVGHPSKIHFSCSKDNLNVGSSFPFPHLPQRRRYFVFSDVYKEAISKHIVQNNDLT